MDDFLAGDYVVTGVIGEGACGLVLRAYRQENLKEVAVKVVERDALSASMRSMLATEIEILQRTASERVVELIEVREDDTHTYMVLEYVSGGDLYAVLAQRERALGEIDALHVAEGVLEALVHLHGHGIAHRDIKLENIMLADGACTGVKLVDFGMAHWRKDPLESQLCTERLGTLEYLAPQIVASQPYVPEQVDMWCVGVVMHILLTGRPPFLASRPEKLYKAILTQEICLEGPDWQVVSEGTRLLVNGLLSKDPTRRPTAAQCLRTVRQTLSTGPEKGIEREVTAARKVEDAPVESLGVFMVASMGLGVC